MCHIMARTRAPDRPDKQQLGGNRCQMGFFNAQLMYRRDGRARPNGPMGVRAVHEDHMSIKHIVRRNITHPRQMFIAAIWAKFGKSKKKPGYFQLCTRKYVTIQNVYPEATRVARSPSETECAHRIQYRADACAMRAMCAGPMIAMATDIVANVCCWRVTERGWFGGNVVGRTGHKIWAGPEGYSSNISIATSIRPCHIAQYHPHSSRRQRIRSQLAANSVGARVHALTICCHLRTFHVYTPQTHTTANTRTQAHRFAERATLDSLLVPTNQITWLATCRWGVVGGDGGGFHEQCRVRGRNKWSTKRVVPYIDLYNILTKPICMYSIYMRV